MSAWIFFVRLLLFWSGRLGMTGTRLLNGVRKATEIIPARRDVHRLAQGRFDPVRDRQLRQGDCAPLPPSRNPEGPRHLAQPGVE